MYYFEVKKAMFFLVQDTSIAKMVSMNSIVHLSKRINVTIKQSTVVVKAHAFHYKQPLILLSTALMLRMSIV